jgi:hypothetical protein
MAKKVEKIILTPSKARDLKIGGKVRRVWARLLKAGEAEGIDRDKIEAFVSSGGLYADEEQRKQIARDLGIDPDSIIAFLEALAPFILEMMAACS